MNEAFAAGKMKAAELTRIMQVAEGTILYYRKGRYEPVSKRRKDIADILGVDEQWIPGLNVPMKSS